MEHHCHVIWMYRHFSPQFHAHLEVSFSISFEMECASQMGKITITNYTYNVVRKCHFLGLVNSNSSISPFTIFMINSLSPKVGSGMHHAMWGAYLSQPTPQYWSTFPTTEVFEHCHTFSEQQSIAFLGWRSKPGHWTHSCWKDSPLFVTKQ